MRHRKGNRKLSRPTDQRLSMLRSLVESLFLHRRVKTTEARAKEARKLAEHIITLAKQGGLSSRRLAASLLRNSPALKELFASGKERFTTRPGGYTRITKVEGRRGDGATQVILELIED